MTYNKTTWLDHIVVEGEIVQEGTPLSANNMNKIEAGIEAANANSSANDNIIGKRTIENPTIDSGTSNDFITNLLNLFTTAIRAIRTSLTTHTTSGGHSWTQITGKPASYTPDVHSHTDATTSENGFMSSTDKTNLDKLNYRNSNAFVKTNFAGTGSALTATLNTNAALTAYYDGLIIAGIIPNNVTPTANVTLNVNGLGAKPIMRYGSDGSIQPLSDGLLKSGCTYIFASIGAWSIVSYTPSWLVLELTKPMPSDISPLSETGRETWVGSFNSSPTLTKNFNYSKITNAKRGEITFTGLSTSNVILKASFVVDTSNCLVTSSKGIWSSAEKTVVTGTAGIAIKCLGPDNVGYIASITLDAINKKIVVVVDGTVGTIITNCVVDWEVWG